MIEKGEDKPLSIAGRAARKARVIGNELFLELNHDPSRAALLLGSGRSGTTWLGEMLARQSGSRFLFEPYHPNRSPLERPVPLFLVPDDDDPATRLAASRVLEGRVRSRGVDQVVTARMSRSRIVKDVHASNLLPWFRGSFPAVPIVYVVRHPIPTAISHLRAGGFYGLAEYIAAPENRELAESSPVAPWLAAFDEYNGHSEPLVRQVAEWCLENAYPLSFLGDNHESLAFYESVVLQPEAELKRLGELCASAVGEPRTDRLTAEDIRKPSAKDWFGTAAKAQEGRDWKRIVGGWRTKVSPAEVEQCLEVLAAFDLDRLYGDDPLPLAAPGLAG
jgi:hypothetical protein